MKLKVLVVGATGMLGSTIFRTFCSSTDLSTYGTIRDIAGKKWFDPEFREKLIPNVNVESEHGLTTAFSIAKPDVVINCVGIIKQLPISNNHFDSLTINALLPHRIAKYCNMIGARLIHFSTDCVFSGSTGNYLESESPNAHDLYGRTKYLGEINYGNAITLRTSLIGHELVGNNSLVDWFLSQSEEVKGYQRAIFSGLPTVEIAKVIKELIIPNLNLKGLYHLSVNPTNKKDLLCLIAQIYGKKIRIVSDDALLIDRSLNSDRFRLETGFVPKSWPKLIQEMHSDYMLFQKSNSQK